MQPVHHPTVSYRHCATASPSHGTLQCARGRPRAAPRRLVMGRNTVASVRFVCLLLQSLALTPAPQPVAPATKKVRPPVNSTAWLHYNTTYGAMPRQYRVLRTVARAVLNTASIPRLIPRVIPRRYRVNTACMPRKIPCRYRVNNAFNTACNTASIPRMVRRCAARTVAKEWSRLD